MTAAEGCSVLDVPQHKQSLLFTDSVLSSPTHNTYLSSPISTQDMSVFVNINRTAVELSEPLPFQVRGNSILVSPPMF